MYELQPSGPQPQFVPSHWVSQKVKPFPQPVVHWHVALQSM